jgi:hypothetical protein
VADIETVRRIAVSLPATEEGVSYGTPAWRVGGKFVARMREDDILVARVDPGERTLLMATEPEIFFITDHYRDWPMVLVRLAAIPDDELAEVLEDAWRMSAPSRLVKQRDEEAASSR